MKYTKQQAKLLKNKDMNGYTKYILPVPDVKIVDGYFIIESKMNLKTKN